MKQRNLPFYFPEIPVEFELSNSALYVSTTDGSLVYGNTYLHDSDVIGFDIIQNTGEPLSVYEKDEDLVEEYQYNGITHYLFSNLDNQVAVWSAGDLEYSISTTLSKDMLKELLQSVY